MLPTSTGFILPVGAWIFVRVSTVCVQLFADSWILTYYENPKAYGWHRHELSGESASLDGEVAEKKSQEN